MLALPPPLRLARQYAHTELLGGLSEVAAHAARVRWATTREEREAIYRFRYRVFHEELRVLPEYTDHARKWFWDQTDEDPSMHHMYCGDLGDLKGAARVHVWPVGEIPPEQGDEFCPGLFPGIERLRCAEIGRFMIDRGARGSWVALAMAREMFLFLGERQRIDLVFSSCRPGLVPLYARLGSRPYGGKIYATPSGLVVPLVSAMSDEAYYRQVGAPTAPLIRKVFGPGRRAPLDLRPFEPLFRAGEAQVLLQPARVEAALREAQGGPHTFLGRLPPEALRGLSRHGLALELKAGDGLLDASYREREVFVVLRGELEVHAGGASLARLGPGEVVGEVGFFRETGERSASVRALTDAQVVVLRHKFLHKLAQDTPRLAFEVSQALGAVLAERLAASNRARGASS
jgi:CRP-like cAMP-binding protein